MTTPNVAPADTSVEPASGAGRTSARRVAMVVGCAAVVALVRWWTSRQRVVFHMNPDEPGQLAMARFLGGGTRWDMFDHSTWRPGYAALISPITWFSDDPVLGIRGALVVNAVLGGIACGLLFGLARRLTPLSDAWCALAALVVSLAPALLFTTEWVWSEALVQVTYLGCLLAVLRFVQRPAIGAGAAAAVLAASGFAAHSRLVPLSLVVITVVVLSWRRRQLTAGRAGGLVALVAALDVVVYRASSWVVDHVWDDPTGTNTAGGVAGRLGKVTAIVASMFGQVWYQLVATLGVAGLGALALARAARRRRPTPGPPDAGSDRRPDPDAARAVLATVVLLVGLSIVFMADRWRPDQLVYGRYNDVAMAPVVLAGVGALVLERRARLRRDLAVVVGVTVVSGVVLRAWRDDELRAAGAVRSMMLGLLAHLGRTTEIEVIGITVVAAVLIGALGLLAVAGRGRTRSVIVGASLGVLLVGGYARTRPVVDRGMNSWDIADDAGGLADVLPEGATVRMRLVPTSDAPSASWAQQRLRSMLYQFYLPDNRVVRDTAPAPWTPYVFAPLGDPDLVAAGARVLWRDQGVSMGLWEEPAPGNG